MSFALLLVCALPFPVQQYGKAAEEVSYYSAHKGNELGAAMTPIRDSDGDGWTDLLVGAPGTSYAGTDHGSVYVLSSRDGSVLLRVDGSQRNGGFGTILSRVGDLNGDGREEFIVGEPGFDVQGARSAGGFRIFSGLDGAVIHEIRGDTQYMNLGSSVAGGKDLDGDGVPDFVVCAAPSSRQQFSRAYVCSGASLLPSFIITSPLSGIRLCAITSDLSGDGLADVVLVNDDEELLVYTGNAGSLLYSWSSREAGNAVAEVGDLDFDGIPELLSGGYLGSVLLSGATGTLLRRIPGEPSTGAGAAVAGPGDLNHDGVPDLAIAGPYAWRLSGDYTGEVRIYSGADGSLLQLIESLDPSGRFGTTLAALGDLDGDGVGEFAIGTPFADNRGYADSGKIAVWSYRVGLRARQQDLSAASGGRLDLLVNFGPTFAGKRYQLLASGSGSGHFHFGVDIPLTFDNLTVSTMGRQYPALIAPHGFVGRLDDQGRAEARAQFPAGVLGPRIGTTIAFAAITLPSTQDPLPDCASAAVELLIAP